MKNKLINKKSLLNDIVEYTALKLEELENQTIIKEKISARLTTMKLEKKAKHCNGIVDSMKQLLLDREQKSDELLDWIINPVKRIVQK